MPGTVGPALHRFVQNIGDGACAQARSCFGAGCTYIRAWLLCIQHGFVCYVWLGELGANFLYRLLMSFFAEDAELELWDLLTCHRTAT